MVKNVASIARLPLAALVTVLCFHQGGGIHAADEPHAIHARMMRYPDVSATHISFTYAGDIWVAPLAGGVAVRLSSPRGEESFPRFSPDGSQIAFSATYDGNQDLYVVPTTGGLPRRVTHHGAADRLVDWFPNGKELLYATSMTSYKDRFNQLYRVSVEGGLPVKLPMPYGEFGALSPDASRIAYTPITVDFRTWKRYRGGMNPDIWLFDLQQLTARNLTQSDAAESVPMWHGDTLYFLSDRDENKRANLWAYDFKTEAFRQVTRFKDHDVHFPSLGPGHIVFEHAGGLHLLDLKTEQYSPVSIQVVTDQFTVRPRLENVASMLHGATVSPNGKRALFAARGDIFSVPAEHGVVRNLTRSSGVAERYPAWSPDGKWIAYFSDRTGEYELTVRNADYTGEEETLTRLGAGYRYLPQWSPDARKIAWIDQAMKIHVYDFDTKETRLIDRQLWMYHGELEGFRVSWSPDSRWITYAGDTEIRNSCVVLYDTKEQKRHQVTAGFYDDNSPVFSPDGKYLFFSTGRQFRPTYSDLDNTWIYFNTHHLAAVPLRQGVPSPLAPRNDDELKQDKEKEGEKKEPKKEEEAKPEAEKAAGAPEGTAAEGSDEVEKKKEEGDKKEEKKDDKKPKPVEIDLEGFEQRVVLLPPKPGQFSNLAVIAGKVLFRYTPRGREGPVAIEFYDLEKRETKRVVEDADGFQLAAKGEKLLVIKDGKYSIIDAKEGQNLNKKLEVSDLPAPVDPKAEWRQIFADAWRFQRDYFYDPQLHGVEWAAIREQYSRLLEDAVTRWDVNYVLGELLGELNASHTYRGGGDLERPAELNVGYLGCDFSLADGAYKIARIIRGAPWDLEVVSPLAAPGITNVQEGDFLLAVNGTPVDPAKDPWAAFQGLGNKPVFLTLNTNASLQGAREVLVQTLSQGQDARLRHLAWINENRLRVQELSGGRIAYVYVPDTGQNGQNELVRQWRGQLAIPGMIIDERFNSGGQIPDRFVELLNRPLNNYWGVRDGKDWPWPPAAHFGPKAMLMNGWSGSGGDCFPFFFKQAGLGPLIGMRTWGGLIGITGAPPLVDGGNVTVPTFGIFSRDGEWIIEGYGVDPDIEVVDDPGLMAKGGDPQLERAVKEVLKAIETNPPPGPRKPPYPHRAR